jgi:hypothetical protein
MKIGNSDKALMVFCCYCWLLALLESLFHFEMHVSLVSILPFLHFFLRPVLPSIFFCLPFGTAVAQRDLLVQKVRTGDIEQALLEVSEVRGGS